VANGDAVIQVLIRGLSGLFQSALTISFPILGTLLLVSITMGLLAKASPQMDVLTMGFPLAIGVSFLLIFAAMPFLITAFVRIVDGGFETISAFIAGVSRGGP
jgi:flagellar biosynthetic protein FliR